jgi:pimeloyl-ACP methyl ester carboxylesterase
LVLLVACTPIQESRAIMKRRLGIDKTVMLTINGSTQHVRLCAERSDLPPLLIVQAGPGFPSLHEVSKFQRLLHLESDFLVTYWDQRGCGNASRRDASSVSLQQQVEDVRTVLQWVHDETKQRVIVCAISLGATFTLRAVEHEPTRVRAVVAISPDSDTARSDAAVHAFLHEHGARDGSGRLKGKLEKLGAPPYTEAGPLQQRARLLTDLGAIEQGRTFNSLLRETLFGMVRTYGPIGTAKALRNMNLIQNRLLPPLVSLNLFTNPPRVAVPIHYIFGEQDALNPVAIVQRLPATIAAPGSTAILVPQAGHMVHFDQPEVVRAIAVGAAMSSDRTARTASTPARA